jgi:hypothetical protein
MQTDDRSLVAAGTPAGSRGVQTKTEKAELSAIERVWITGDLAPLTPEQRVQYYVARCERAGLDPVTQPFDYLELQGKLVLYAKKAATDQISQAHKLSVTIVEQGMMPGSADHYYARARVVSPDGRTTEDQGVLWLWSWSKKAQKYAKNTGEDLSNAIMKCITKAKRRTIISHTGLGMLDESEVEAMRKAPEATQGSAPSLNTDSPTVVAGIPDDKAQAQASHSAPKRVSPKAPEPDAAAGDTPFTFPAGSPFFGKTILEAAATADHEQLRTYTANLEASVLKKANAASAYKMTGKEYPQAQIHKSILILFRLELESRAKRGIERPQAATVAPHDPDFDRPDQVEMGV